MTGFTEAAKTFLLGTGAGPWGILLVMVAIWFVLGCLIDSISIILLTVPIFAPIAAALGFDPLAFAIIGILAIETGLLTPPFGILVFTVKSAVPDPDVHASRNLPRRDPLLDRAARAGGAAGGVPEDRDVPAESVEEIPTALAEI